MWLPNLRLLSSKTFFVRKANLEFRSSDSVESDGLYERESSITCM